MNWSALTASVAVLGVAAICGCAGRTYETVPSRADGSQDACTLTPQNLEARKEVIKDLTRGVLEKKGIDGGLAFKFVAEAGVISRLTHLMELERDCCQFLSFRLTVMSHNGPIWFEVTGPASSRHLIDEYFGHQ